jgi:hypothetical protein
LAFTVCHGKDWVLACRRGIVGDQRKTCFLLGRDLARAKVEQRRKIIDPKIRSLATAPDLLPVLHSFY